MSVRWQHCIDLADTKQKPLMWPDCLLGVVPQPTDSRLSETSQCPVGRAGSINEIMEHSVILIVRSDAYRVDWNTLLMSSG